MKITIRTLFAMIAIAALVLAAYQAGHSRATNKLTPHLRSKFNQPVSKRIDIQLQVLSADTQQPISNARLELTLAHPYGNGAFTSYVTDENGFITTSQPLYSAYYQVDIYPPANSGYEKRAYFFEYDTMLKIEPDGTYAPKQFKVENQHSSKVAG